jgi:hypothetical protein
MPSAQAVERLEMASAVGLAHADPKEARRAVEDHQRLIYGE